LALILGRLKVSTSAKSSTLKRSLRGFLIIVTEEVLEKKKILKKIAT
jgi:hypothetical protein